MVKNNFRSLNSQKLIPVGLTLFGHIHIFRNIPMKVRKQEVLQVDCEEMPNFRLIRGMHIKTQETISDPIGKIFKI